MNIAGIYSRYDHPDSGGWVNHDAIFIYQDEHQRLAYNFYLEKEDNYSRRYVFEEGFVYLEAADSELHFEQLQRYEYASGRAMGYDLSYYHSYTYQPRQVMQVFHIFNEAEIASSSLAQRIISYKGTKMVLLEKGKDLLYEQVNDGELSWYQSVEGLEIIILNTREELHKNWQDWVKNFVYTRLAQGVPPDEVAANCDWTLQAVQAHLDKKMKRLARKKK